MKAVKGKHLFGGVHPRDCKSVTQDKPLENMPAPDRVYISTSQSLGKPATPAVEKGQRVAEGQLIAKSDGVISSDVFSSVAGTVTDIKDMAGF